MNYQLCLPLPGAANDGVPCVADAGLEVPDVRRYGRHDVRYSCHDAADLACNAYQRRECVQSVRVVQAVREAFCRQLVVDVGAHGEPFLTLIDEVKGRGQYRIDLIRGAPNDALN